MFRLKIVQEIQENNYTGSIYSEDYDYYLAEIITHLYLFCPKVIKEDIDWWKKHMDKGILKIIINDALNK